MRKLLSYVIVFTMLFSSFSAIAMPKSATAAPVNKQATFIANRFVKLGFDRDGLPLYPTRLFPWQKTANIQVWGRDGFPMPHAYYARDLQNINVPATDIDADVETFEENNVVPVMWTDFYLTVYPDGGRSTEYDHFYAVLDSAGQLWFDPDGTFHDPRYNAYTDPRSSYYIDGSCKTGINPYAVDPSSDNNTQGPYIINPSHPLYNPNTSITVSLKGRKFQLGYVDMVDYLPERVITSDNNMTYSNRPNDEHAIKFNPTTVLPYQWDIGLPLVNFRTQFTWTPDNYDDFVVFSGDEMFHQYHARTQSGYSITINLAGNGSSSYSTYDPYEYIYRKGPGNMDPIENIPGANGGMWFTGPQPIVQVGDIRLADVSYKSWDGSTVFNYPANSVVKPSDADAPQDYDHNGILEIDEYKVLCFFNPYMKHTETLFDGRNLANLADITNIYYDVEQRSDLGYTISEWVYRDRDFDLSDGNDPNGDSQVTAINTTDTRVQPDTRYSPVNTKMNLARPFNVTLLNGNEPYSINDFNRTLVGAYPWNYQDQLYRDGLGLVGWDAISKAQGDMLILSEMLRGGCESPTYDLSVQTDAWMGTDVGIGGGDKKMMPSFTAARLRSPNGDIETNSQRIQKNTVLAPNGTSFFIPATTFHNIKLEYREYIGVEIFKDNGIDNHIGINLPQDKLYEQNLSDDYMDERTGEEFLGAVNGVNAKDFGMSLIPFSSNYLYYDSNLGQYQSNGDTNYGCGEPIYKLFYGESVYPDEWDRPFEVMAGDMRVNGVTVEVNGNEIFYAPGTYVTAGDADVGFMLQHFNPNQYGFVDRTFPELDIELNRQYDYGEFIYRFDDTFTTWDPNGQIYNYKATYPGEWLRYVRPNEANGHATKSVPVYLDLDNNMNVTLGDVRMTYVRNKSAYGTAYYPLYSTVRPNDTDLGLTLYPTPQIGFNEWNSNSFDDVYIDMDYNVDTASGGGTVNGKAFNYPSVGADVRLTELFGYPIGSTPFDKNEDGLWQDWENGIKPDDKDIGYHLAGDPSLTPNDLSVSDPAALRISVTADGKYFIERYGTFGVYDGIQNDYMLNPRTVGSNNIRLTEVTINGFTYDCGSHVSSGDYWYYQNPVHKLTMGYNCDFRFMDMAVQPGPLGLQIKMDQPFKVEQTTQLDITLTTPLEKGEEVYILIEDVYAKGNQGNFLNPDLIYKKLDYEQQLITMQITPYRGSCGETATYPLRIWAFRESGGVSDIVPPTNNIDPFQESFLDLDEMGNIPNIDAPVPPSPPLPKKLTTSYDCYALNSYNVLPEDLWIGSATKCVSTLYQRFPNLTMRLYDADNPNDVNDPANMRISIPAGDYLVANYNAAGGGIAYMLTGTKYTELQQVDTPGNNGIQNEKVIIQVNKDATFLYWNWLDQTTGPLSGVLDNADTLYGATIDDPMYIRSYDRIRHENSDCSNRVTCGDCMITEYPNTIEITRNDFMMVQSTKMFKVLTFGVPTLVTNYAYYSNGDPGGEIRIVVNPIDASSKLKIRVYTMNALFDYNSAIQHPPYFVYDPYISADRHGVINYGGIDYCGYREFKVLPPDPYVNFAELKIVDHALQNSKVNYTSGFEALSELPTPTPQIESPYDPIVKDVGRDLRAYPGGQTHTGRIEGSVFTGSYYRSEGEHNGWNAYPAIWFWYWYDNVDYNDFTDFNKLGTEFYPLTDYSLAFIMKDGEGNHLSLDPNVDIDLRVRKLEISGPFMTPIIFNQDTKSVRSGWTYNGVRNVPIKYDYSGKIVLDPSNWLQYEVTGDDWTRSSKDGLYPLLNSYLQYSHDLDYTGLTNVIRIPEIIPVSNGNIKIEVTLWDNTVKIFQDCCAEPPTDGITSHGLEIVPSSTGLTVMNDNKVEVTVKEFEPMQTVQPANNAVVVAWQDRGIRNRDTGLFDGAGDGWLTNPPTSSDQTDAQYQYDQSNDMNLDGKISFADYETEIIGTYDLATNTWHAGIVDARTYQRDNGKYIFDLSSSNGALVTQTGLDFGAFDKNGAVIEKPDHVISEFETLPVTITAYKYGDDNNDRAFTPLYNLGDTIPQFSHEVYLAGQIALDVLPMQDISISVSPTVLTAGCIPELVDPASPLTIIVTDAEGEPVNLTHGVPDNNGEELVDKEDIWMHLFQDKHPTILPQYYWLRTDLHNKDYTNINNSSLYNKEFYPIKADFTLAEEGKYTFNGFCANDKGEFDVYVYTPDRAHFGIGKVKVELPNTEYSIANFADPAGNTFTVPGEPDFVMTAADNRLYKVTVTVKDARGILTQRCHQRSLYLRRRDRRTRHDLLLTLPDRVLGFLPKETALFLQNTLCSDLYPYNLNVGFDFNDNQKIDQRNSELYTLGGFNHLKRGLVYYNTTNVMYDKYNVLEWDITANLNLPPFTDPITQKPIRDGAPRRPENPTGTATIGWGLGSIYNSPYYGGLLLADLDGTGYLDYHDSLGLDVNGQTTFYLFAEDLAYVGGLVGQNAYCNNLAQADLAGNPPPNKTDPGIAYKRYHSAHHPPEIILPRTAFSSSTGKLSRIMT